MPSFDELHEEMHRLALEWGHSTIAGHIAAGRDPGGEHRTIYDAIVDRAYKNLCEDEKAKEWEILRVTEPKARH